MHSIPTGIDLGRISDRNSRNISETAETVTTLDGIFNRPDRSWTKHFRNMSETAETGPKQSKQFIESTLAM
jgi:hypothetical protein